MSEQEHETGETPGTTVGESDPNADSHEGLEGGMGVSSERPGSIRGQEPDQGPVATTSAPTHPDAPGEATEKAQEADAAYPAPQEEPNPFDPDRNPRHAN